MSEILKNKKANKQKYIAFRVSEQEEIFFKKQAEELGLSISEFARQILFKNQSVVEQDQNQIEYLKSIQSQQLVQNKVFLNQTFMLEVIKLFLLDKFQFTEDDKLNFTKIAHEKIRKAVKDLELPK